MHYHQNHQWCTYSNWTDGMFDAKHSVRIEQYLNHNDEVDVDWTNLISRREIIDTRKRALLKEDMIEHGEKIDDVYLDMISTVETVDLNQDVINWLMVNVADSTDKAMKDQPQGWAMGNDNYRSHNYGMDITIWFLRRIDAMQFIKTWSIHQKPTTFCNYFKDDRRTLIGGKLIRDDLLVEISHEE